jgi:tetratricopeptide (TPR) repeat protein
VNERGKQILPTQKKASEEAQIYFTKGEQFRQVKKYREAIDEYNKALVKDPTNAKIEFQKAACFISLSDEDNAIVSLLKTVTLKSDYTEAYSRLGNLYQKKGKTTEAIFYFDRAFNYATTPKEKQDYKLGIIQILAKQGKYTEMGLHIDAVKNISSDNLLLMYYSAKYYNNTSNYESARTTMERATQLLKLKSTNPSEIAGYYYELGYAYHKLEMYKEAKEALRYANVGSYKALVAEMTPEYVFSVASAYHELFDLETSLSLLEDVLKMDSKFAQAHELKIRISSVKTDKSLVIKDLKNAAEAESLPLNKVPKLMDACKYELGNRKFNEAIGTSETIISYQPTNYIASFYKSIALQQSGKQLDAIRELQNILSFSGLDTEVKSKCYFLIGNIYRDMGDLKSAEKAYKNVTQGNYRYAANRENKKLKEQ